VISDRCTRLSPRSAFLLSSLLFLSFVAPALPLAAQSVSVTDDRGKAVTLARPAQRIVALAPSLAEMAHAAGAGARLVGVSRHSDFPPAVRGLPQVGDAVRVDFERIAALKPDLVLAWRSGNSAADVERLEQLGFPAYASEPRRLADIARQLRAIGTLAGTQAAADKAASEFERGVDALLFDYSFKRRIRVFYEVWRKPLMTVGGTHLISEIISTCGGENVFSGLAQLTPTIGAEALIAAKPQAIIGGGSASGSAEAYLREAREQALLPLKGVPVFYVDPDLVQRPTPRILEGAKAICSALEQVREKRR
jgi:iron complex transport system substrate-binding protein